MHNSQLNSNNNNSNNNNNNNKPFKKWTGELNRPFPKDTYR